MSTQTIEHVLGPSGPVARALGPGFEPRPEQLAMAARVAHAMDTKSHLLVEAGTGTGKSFAYLVPAFLRAATRGEVVVIATNTIALQEQLVARDIPLLQATATSADAPSGQTPDDLDDDPSNSPAELWGLPAVAAVRPVLVKGRGNYVSIRRLKLASQRQDSLPDAAARRSLHVIEDWAYDTTDGTLATLPPLDRPGVWDRVQSDSGNCMGRKCPTYQQCFYQQARRRMEAANVLVCNHALFFSDLALRARGVGFLPNYQHVILDEAHGVEDAAADHFGVTLTEGRVVHLLSTLYQHQTGKGYLAHLEVAAGDTAPIAKTVAIVHRAEQACRALFESVVHLSRRMGPRSSGRLREPGQVDNPLTPAMNDLTLALRALKELVRTEADKFELNAYAERSAEIADAAEVLIDQTAAGCCYWCEVGSGTAQVRGRQIQRVSLACSPIDVAPLLAQHLFTKDHSVVLTSATLATRRARPDEPPERAETAFAHAMERLGCAGASTLQVGSPFDYAAQVELLVDTTMPAPEDAPAGRYERELARRVAEHVRQTDGGAFVLFTSFATLNRVADLIAPEMAVGQYPLYVQGKDLPRSEMLERFRADPRSVLLGAASFWQGVDVRGDALRNVIIARLPFEPPDRPLTEARLERIKDRGGDPFREDSLPRAVIRFKQGFGRLIRSRTDRGRVVVLDPRILTKSYGRRFLDALPDGLVPTRI